MRTHGDHRWGIVLAAGEGSRIRDYVRQSQGIDLPKQFATFTGTRSLLRHTLDRIEQVFTARHVVTIVNQLHQHIARPILTREEQRSLLLVPSNKETAPNILVAALRTYRYDPNATIVIFPSDHFIIEEERFMGFVRSSMEYVERHQDLAVLLGVQPDRPDPEYGWIELRHAFDIDEGNRFFHVSQFHEKPPLRTALQLYTLGAVWNTLVVVSRVDTLINLFRKSAPELLHAAERILPFFYTQRESQAIEEFFDRIQPMSFSKSILEQHSSRLRVRRMEGVRWSDWGTGERVERELEKFGQSPKPMLERRHHPANQS